MRFRILLILIAFFLSVIFYLYKYIKRTNIGTLDFEELTNLDLPFILYLRSFNDDSIGGKLPISMFNLLNISRKSFEEEISQGLNKHLLISVGKPDERFPELGSLRLYLNDDEWKEKIITLIQNANKIIIKPAKTKGFEWELNTILKNGHLKKLIIFNQLSNFNNVDLNTLYYDNLKTKIFESTKIKMSGYNDKMRYHYFDDNFKHIQCKNLREIIHLSLNEIIDISNFKNSKKYLSPLKKVTNFTYKVLFYNLMITFIFCFIYMVFDFLVS